MTTFSAESRPRDGRAATPTAEGFLRIDRRAVVRLCVAVLLGVAAIVAPAVVPAVGSTGAVYTDQERSTMSVTTAPTFSPTPDATPPASLSSPPAALTPAATLSAGHAPRKPHPTSKTP